MLKRIFPFLTWFEGFDASVLRADFVSGLTVALVLVPQSMAYAQLAGLPAYYGLYAAFLPPMVAAMFGSSRQLATGPVAVVSLMTATALEPLAVQGSESFIAYAILLAVLVGLVQFGLGVLRLGIVVNFLSHPVVLGFTNAAAIIIATSQLSKLFGVDVDKGDYHYQTIWNVVVAAMAYTHWPTFGMAVLSILIMVLLRRFAPKVPNVLVAVVVTILVAGGMGFEVSESVDLSRIESPAVVRAVREFNTAVTKIDDLSARRAELTPSILQAEDKYGKFSSEAIVLRHQADLLQVDLDEWTELSKFHRSRLREMHFNAVKDADGELRFFAIGQTPPDLEKEASVWRLKVKNTELDEAAIPLTGGGAVVGVVPRGLPKLGLPKVDLFVAVQLIPVAAIISLLGFMEAISIAKAMAAKTGQRLDANQELIGQGLANMIGAVGQSYPVSGSFSRSAVNIATGAQTGLSSVFTSGIVIIVLLFFTPFLYHLPQAVLASIIMMAVIRLIDFPAMVRAWRTQKYDGVISGISFACTLGFAPHLEKGIMIGVVLSLGTSLFRLMRPTVATLTKHPDGSFRSAGRWGLQRCQYIAPIRFNGSLFFVSASYLENEVLTRVANMPNLRHVLFVGNAINDLDASGEEMLSSLVDRLRDAGYEVSFSGLNDAILDVMRRTHLYEKIGEDHFFRNVQTALQSIHAVAHVDSREKECPLLQTSYQDPFEGLRY